MNLKVDLILPTEQRSASVLNVKSLVRIASVIIPILVAMVIGNFILGMLQTRNRLNQLESQWNTASPQQDDALTLREQLQTHRRVLSEIEGWRSSRFVWSEQLNGLLDQVPESIQLRQYRVSQTLHLNESSTQPVRAFGASLAGVAEGRSADDDVQALKIRLSDTEPFASKIASVEVPAFGADPSPSASKSDRIFRIEMRYQPRPFQ
jgi:Tfp pilus assembly protein PilN